MRGNLTPSPCFFFFPVLKIRACAQSSVELFPVQIESVSKGEEKKMNYKLPEVWRGGCAFKGYERLLESRVSCEINSNKTTWISAK